MGYLLTCRLKGITCLLCSQHRERQNRKTVQMYTNKTLNRHNNNNNNNNNNNRFLFVSFFPLHSFLFYVTLLAKITPNAYFKRILHLHYYFVNYATFAVIKHREINAVVRVDGKAYKRGESLNVLQVVQVIHVAYLGFAWSEVCLSRAASLIAIRSLFGI